MNDSDPVRQRPAWRMFFRAAVSFVLIAWLLRRIAWQEIPVVFQRAHPGFLTLTLLLLLVERGVSVWKWWVLLRARRLPVGYWRLFGINYAGNFIGMFLPSSVSTDVVRGVFLARFADNAPVAAASILVDRVTGLLALVLVTALALVFAPPIPGVPLETLRIWVAVLIVMAAIGSFVLMWRGNQRWFEYGMRRLRGGGRPAARAADWLQACLVFRNHPGWLSVNLGLSAAVQVIRVVTFYVLARVFVDPAPPILSFFLFVPIILLLIMLPVSLSGIGVRENVFVALFGVTGLMLEGDAFVVSFSMTLLVTLTALPGAWFYFRGLHAKKDM